MQSNESNVKQSNFFSSCGRYIHDTSPNISEMNKQKKEMGIKNNKNNVR